MDLFDNQMKNQHKDRLDEDLNNVVAYLVHCKKDEHVATVLRAIRRLAASNDQVGRLQQELERYRMQQDRDMMGCEPREPERVVKLPFGTRKVSIEL